MKAVIIDTFGGADTVKVSEMPQPHLLDHEVKIQVKYAAVNPVDWKIREGRLKNHMDHHFPIILGWDAAGIITELGKDAGGLKVGDEVFAFCKKKSVQWGTFAEYVCMEANDVVVKPQKISLAEAAAIPLTALTAWQALFDFSKLKAGEVILIQAGAGGVGGMAIQLAKYAGAIVVTTASQKNHAYVKKFGADTIVDYENKNVAEEVKKVFPDGLDVILDTVGGEALKLSYPLLKEGGRLAVIVEPPDYAAVNQFHLKAGYISAHPQGSQLKVIAELIDQGKVVAPAIEIMKLEDAKEALRKSQAGHVKGKIVLAL